MPSDTILILIDELKAPGVARRTRDLLDALSDKVRPVVVAQTYLPQWHAARWLPFSRRYYAFAQEDWDAQMRAFAADLCDRFRPRWALAYGWENPVLVAEVDNHDVPSLIYLDQEPPDAASAKSMVWAARHAEEVVLGGAYRLDPDAPMLTELRRREPRILQTSGSSAGTGGRRRFLQRRQAPPEALETAQRLVDIGETMSQRHARSVARSRQDAATIIASGRFNAELCRRPDAREEDDASILRGYFRDMRTLSRSPDAANALADELRRLSEGFHPLVYATENHAYGGAGDGDPLAHYLRSGRPKGRWAHLIIRPSDDEPKLETRAALHAHLYYPELASDLAERLRRNRSRPDLIVTTSSAAARDEIEKTLDGAGRAAREIVIVPNRGRDIWPFFTLLGQGAFAAYDVVGHVHGKRSLHNTIGDAWRDFLWRHLIGGPEPMMDVVASALATDPALGLVFAEDPHLVGWSGNLEIATEMARRAELPLPLPTYFDFPVGSMFWARPAALAPLLDFRLTEDMIPEEPVANDGTVLHAIERLVAFAAEKAGYTFAATHVPGSTR